MRVLRWHICFVLAIVSSLMVPSTVLADHPPETYNQSVTSFAHRRNSLVRAAVRQFDSYWEWTFKPWLWSKAHARRQLAFASAVIWVLSHPSDFSNGAGNPDAYDELQFKAIGTYIWSPDNFKATLAYWHEQLLIFFDGIYYTAEEGCSSPDHVGTDCDYDMILVERR